MSKSWKPISSAPKDRSILVKGRDGIYVAEWEDNKWVYGVVATDWNYYLSCNPDYWMELSDISAEGTVKKIYCKNCSKFVGEIVFGSQLRKGLVFLCRECYDTLKTGNMFGDIFGGFGKK